MSATWRHIVDASLARRPSAPSDAELVLRARRGDPLAWELIWQRYARLVRRYLDRHARGDSVDDLVQETFLVLYVAIDRIEQPAALRGFLLGAAARVLYRARRSSARRSRHVLLTASGILPERAATNDEATQFELASALSRLPAQHRTAFVLRHVSGLGLSEVASELEISPSSARRWIDRARRRVMRAMKVA